MVSIRAAVWRKDDEGAALAVALIFLLAVGIMITIGLTKTSSTAQAGYLLRNQAQAQYAADGGVDRALQVLRSDLSNSTPTLCTGLSGPDPGPVDLTASGNSALPDTGGLALNGRTVHYSCQTIAGNVPTPGGQNNTNFAIVTTDSSPGSITTANAVGNPIPVDGTIYLGNYPLNAGLKKEIDISDGGLVAYDNGNFDTCSAKLKTEATDIVTSSTASRTCTAQKPIDAFVHVILPAAPSTVPATPYVDVSVGSDTCRLFPPGKYTSAPALLGSSGHDASANYFISGLYDFEGIGTWTIDNGSVVYGGQPNTTAGDVTAGADISNTACHAFAGTDTAVNTALAAAFTAAGKSLANFSTWSHGTEWVFSGNSSLVVKKGNLSLFSPTPPAGEPSVSLLAARNDTWFTASETKDSGAGRYTPWSGGTNVINNDNPNALMTINGKVLAPDAGVELFASQPSVAVVRGGLVAKTIDLDASAAVSSGQFAFRVNDDSSGSQPDPARRTVRIVAKVDAFSTDSGMTETAEATIDNFGRRPIRVYSWRVNN
jgi:hypothetical protein